jgi:hypothetical protein
VAVLFAVSAMPKLIYLDSSDFSKLSVPDEELSPEDRLILTTLREHKRAGTALYFMSAVHLSEAVHASDTHKSAAVRRAELMRELCGTNILRLPGDLPKLELQKVLAGERNGSLSVDEIRSRQGEWFGVYVPLEGMADNRASLGREIQKLLNNLPRRERRKRRSELDLKKKTSHERWRELLSRGAQSVPVPYPYNLLDRSIVIGWFLGEVSDSEFRDGVLRITHDPYVMFKYLMDEREPRERLYNSLRKQVGTVADQPDERQLITALSIFSKSEIDPDLTALVDKFFSRPATLRQIISSFDVNSNHISDPELPKIIEACPSLLTFVEVNRAKFVSRAYSYLTRIRAGNMSIKELKPSDFGDVMHCYYAPYFDIFRCDASFGANLKRHKPIRDKVAARIGDLMRMLSNDSSVPGREVA